MYAYVLSEGLEVGGMGPLPLV